MRHAGRSVRIRRGRVVAAAASALTIGVAILGSIGVIPVSLPADNAAFAVQERQPVDRDQAPVDRADRAERVPDAGSDAGETADTADTPDTTDADLSPPTTGPEQTEELSQPDEALPADTGTGKRVVYRLSTNQVWLVTADNEVGRYYLVSGTKFDQIDPGTYDVLRKRRHTTSYHGTERMEYMVTFTEGENAAIGFHNIPVDIETGQPVQSLSQLGDSLSDGCVRQRQADARALWDFAPVDTKVVVLA